MDMPISQINARLFSRLPSDIGLGLLFATGAASQVVNASGDRPIQFVLRHAGYALRCKVAPGTEFNFRLAEGQIVRATGHMCFSSQSAQFHLFVRDLELLQEPAESTLAVSVMRQQEEQAPIVKRKNASLLSKPVKQALGDIPDWVFSIAPVEMQDFSWGTGRVRSALDQKVAARQDPEDEQVLAARFKQNESLLAFLLDSLEKSEHEDIILTTEMLSQFQAGALPGNPAVERNNHTTLHRAGSDFQMEELPTAPWVFLAILLFLVGAVLISLYLLVYYGVF